MADWLSEEWLAGVSEMAGSRPPVQGASGTISLAVADGRKARGAYHWSYKDGTPATGGVGPAADADVAMTISSDDARAVAAGEMDPSVAYMRGRLKASGDGGLLLGWLASTATSEYAEWRRRAEAALGEAPPA